MCKTKMLDKNNAKMYARDKWNLIVLVVTEKCK